MKHIPSCTIFRGFRKRFKHPKWCTISSISRRVCCQPGQLSIGMIVQKFRVVRSVSRPESLQFARGHQIVPSPGWPKDMSTFSLRILGKLLSSPVGEGFMGVELVGENKDVNLHFGRFETQQRELFPISSYSKLVWLTGVSISGYDPYWCCGGHCIFPSFPGLKFRSLMMKSAPGCQGKISEGFSASQMNLSGWKWITIFWPTWNIFFGGATTPI